VIAWFVYLNWPTATKVLGTELPCPKAIFAVSWPWSIGPWPRRLLGSQDLKLRYGATWALVTGVLAETLRLWRPADFGCENGAFPQNITKLTILVG